VGHPIVTDGDCGVVILCREGGDAALLQNGVIAASLCRKVICMMH